MEEFKTAISKFVEEKRLQMPKANTLEGLTERLDKFQVYQQEIADYANELLKGNKYSKEEADILVSFVGDEIMTLMK